MGGEDFSSRRSPRRASHTSLGNVILRFDGSLVAEFRNRLDNLFARGFIRVVIDDRFTPLVTHLGGDNAGSALQHRLDPASATCATHPLYGDKHALSFCGACGANYLCRVFSPGKRYKNAYDYKSDGNRGTSNRALSGLGASLFSIMFWLEHLSTAFLTSYCAASSLHRVNPLPDRGSSEAGNHFSP